MENREAGSRCSSLYGVAGRRNASVSQTHCNIIPLKWAKMLVLCTQNVSWGVLFNYCNEHIILLWDFRERILRENGRWSSCLLNLCCTIAETSSALPQILSAPTGLNALSEPGHNWLGPAGTVLLLGLASCLSRTLLLPGAAVPVMRLLAPATTLRLG